MDLQTAHRGAARQFDNRIKLVKEGQWGNNTPCTEWSVRELVNHIVYEQLWVPDLLAGKTIEEVGDRYDGDVLGDDPQAAWASAAAAAAAAVAAPGAIDGTVHLSYGDAPAAEYLSQLVIDLTVHAWDLAVGINVDDEMPNDLSAYVLNIVKENQDALTGSGAFAAPLDTVMCTDDLTELLALLGRARWKAFKLFK